MHMCVSICIYTYICVYVHVCIPMYTHICISVCPHTYILGRSLEGRSDWLSALMVPAALTGHELLSTSHPQPIPTLGRTIVAMHKPCLRRAKSPSKNAPKGGSQKGTSFLMGIFPDWGTGPSPCLRPGTRSLTAKMNLQSRFSPWPLHTVSGSDPGHCIKRSRGSSSMASCAGPHWGV
jgi:hypothetical protein